MKMYLFIGLTVLVVIIGYDMFVKKALKISSYEEGYDNI